MVVMKKLLACLVFVCATLSAQTTSITATVTDSDSQTWNNGSWVLSFVPNPSNPTIANYNINGTPLNPAVLNQKGTMNGSGALSFSAYQNGVITPSGSSWALQVCPNASATCSVYNFSTDLFSSLNLSSSISSIVVAPRFLAVSGTYGYNDSEASLQVLPGSTYFNVTTACQRVWPGGAGPWGCQSTGAGLYVPLAGGTMTGTLINPAGFTGGPIVGSVLQNVWNASLCTGSDLGAQLNACFSSAGTSTVPTILVPTGTYTLSTPVVFSQATKLVCEPGAFINVASGLTGNAITLGTNSITSGQAGTYPYSNPYEISGCTFIGGSGMAQGIYLNPYVVKVRIHDNWFRNFGNAAAYDIYSYGNNWDLRVWSNYAWVDTSLTGPFNYNFMFMNASNNLDGGNTHLYFIDNHIQNSAPHSSGVGLAINGVAATVQRNNFSGMNPDIQILASAGVQSPGTIIDANYFETGLTFTGGYYEYSPCIQLGTSTGSNFISGVFITHNYCNTHNFDLGLGMTFISPAMTGSGGSAGTIVNTTIGLQQSVVQGNTVYGLKTGDVLTTLNNLTSQIGNEADDNYAAVNGAALDTLLANSTAHTAGASITAWTGNNGDLFYFNPTAVRYDWNNVSQRILLGGKIFGYSDSGTTLKFQLDAASGILNLITGLQINTAAPSGHYPRGNGTNYVDGTIQTGDLPSALTPSSIVVNSGTNVVYRCTVAGTLPVGALTINSANCGTAVATSLTLN
jgi:hypothetical protein